MAKSEINMSEQIRNYYQDHPKAKPLQVQAALKEQGMEVAAGTISTVRYNMLKKKKRRGVKASAGRKKAKAATGRQGKAAGNGRATEFIAQLVAAKQLADQMGGVERARQALALLEKLS